MADTDICKAAPKQGALNITSEIRGRLPTADLSLRGLGLRNWRGLRGIALGGIRIPLSSEHTGRTGWRQIWEAVLHV